jgi:hypothetical protein
LPYSRWKDLAAFEEEAMRKSLILLSLALSFFLIYLHGDTKKNGREGYQVATVVSVDKRVSESNYIGSPTDAPLHADDYSYDVSIRLNCNIYVGRYESAIDHLPGVFALNHKVDVILQKHTMRVSLPDGDREVKTGIVHQGRVKGESCTANS